MQLSGQLRMRCWCRHGNDRGDLFPQGLLRPDLDCIPSILGWVIAAPTQLPDLDLTLPPLEQDVLVQWLMDVPQLATLRIEIGVSTLAAPQDVRTPGSTL